MNKNKRIFILFGFTLTLFLGFLHLSQVRPANTFSIPTPNLYSDGIRSSSVISYFVYLPMLSHPRPLIEPIIPTGTPVILFRSDRSGDGTRDIYSMKIDGSDVRRLTSFSVTKDESLDAEWSPDRSQIAVRFNGLLYLMNEDGSNLKKIYDNGLIQAVGQPRWSPDGKMIAFIIYDCENTACSGVSSRNSGVMIYTLNTDSVTSVVNGMTIKDRSGIHWLPDAYGMLANRGHDWDIIKIFADGSKPEFVVDGFYFNFVVSPDGKQYVYSDGGSTGFSKLVQVKLENPVEQILYSSTDNNWLPLYDLDWHPNLNQVAAVMGSKTSEDMTVYTFDVDTHSFEDLTPFDHYRKGVLGWSPDGSYFVYSSSIDRFESIYDLTLGIYVLPEGASSAWNLSPDLSYLDFALDVR